MTVKEYNLKTKIETTREMTPEEIEEAKAIQEEYEKQLASQPPTYEDRLSALESAILELITGGETGG